MEHGKSSGRAIFIKSRPKSIQVEREELFLDRGLVAACQDKEEGRAALMKVSKDHPVPFKKLLRAQDP